MFSNQQVLARLKELNVLLVKADKTIKQSEINADMARYNRVGLPLNIITPGTPGEKGIVLPERVLIEHVNQALDLASSLSKKSSSSLPTK